MIATSCDEPLAAGRVGRTPRGGSTHLVPAATVTTCAKPHGQQQLARDLEVERAVMGQRCRPQSFGEMLSAVFRSAYLVLSTPVVGHPLPISLSGNFRNGLGINTTMKNIYIRAKRVSNCYMQEKKN